MGLWDFRRLEARLACPALCIFQLQFSVALCVDSFSDLMCAAFVQT